MDERIRTWMREMGAKPIAEMVMFEIGYTVFWAVGGWDWLPYPDHLDGLNLCYPVFPVAKGSANLPVCRIEDGWVVDGKLFRAR